jgi:mevalonate kinase
MNSISGSNKLTSQEQYKTSTFRAAGKLMLFGEYLVLNGAQSLAFPLKFGQTLEIHSSEENINWEAFDSKGKWFWCSMDKDLNILETNNSDAATILKKLFSFIQKMNPDIHLINHFKITADFDLNWGFGSSSTFISALSQWAKMNPYELLSLSFGGSGYDIACATAQNPILFQIGESIKCQEVAISKSITEKLLFVYLGKKQNSRDEIKKFQQSEVKLSDIEQMNSLVNEVIKAASIEEFETIVNQSEDLLSPILGREKLKDHIFADYKYSVKSLGAWGGDFILATFREVKEAKEYFEMKGLETMFTYEELVI